MKARAETITWWVEKPIGEKAYDKRFIYYEGMTSSSTYFHRETRRWWKPFEWIGRKLYRAGLILRIDMRSRYYAWIRKNLLYQ